MTNDCFTRRENLSASTVTSKVRFNLHEGGYVERRSTMLRLSMGSLFWKSMTLRLSLVALGSAIYLYLNLFASGEVPFLLGGDQAYFWMGAQKLQSGEMIYRDFFQFTPPGTDLIYAALFSIFGTRIWVSNLVVLVLGVFFACVCFSLARKLMRDRSAALATALFMVFIYGKTLNATHHWFAVLLILLAVRVAMERVSPKSIALSGALLGVAAFFTQVHGAAALMAFSIFLLCRSSRAEQTRIETVKMLALLLLSFAGVLLSLCSYYFATVGIKKLWYCLVVYLLKYLPHQSMMAIGPHSSSPTSAAFLLLAVYVAAYILLPLIYGSSLWRCWRSRHSVSSPWDQVALLSLVGLFLLLDVAVSISWLRLFTVLLPGIVLAVWWADRVQGLRRSVIIATSVVLSVIAAHQIVTKHLLLSVHAELPGGRLATTPQSYEKLRWLADHTHPGEFFLQAGWPGVYLPLQVRNPVYVQTLGRWDVGPDQDIELAMQQMRSKQVPFVLWAHSLDEDCKPTACNDFLSPFRAYLQSSYTPIKTFRDGDVLWQKLDHGAGWLPRSE
jgi:hypothetical protein